MPLYILAAITGGWAWNSVDDALIDPISNATGRPLISGQTVAVLVGVGALFILARRKGLI